jgi:hypothetical protein
MKLSDAAKTVDAYNYENTKLGIWITLDFCFYF